MNRLDIALSFWYNNIKEGAFELTFKELTDKYYDAKWTVRETEELLNTAVKEYLDTWTNCKVEDISSISYGPFPEVFVIYTYDKYGNFKIYEIPYDDEVPGEENGL